LGTLELRSPLLLKIPEPLWTTSHHKLVHKGKMPTPEITFKTLQGGKKKLKGSSFGLPVTT